MRLTTILSLASSGPGNLFVKLKINISTTFRATVAGQGYLRWTQSSLRNYKSEFPTSVELIKFPSIMMRPRATIASLLPLPILWRAGSECQKQSLVSMALLSNRCNTTCPQPSESRKKATPTRTWGHRQSTERDKGAAHPRPSGYKFAQFYLIAITNEVMAHSITHQTDRSTFLQA